MSLADSSHEENVSCVYCNDDREIKKKVHRVSQYWIKFARWSLYCLSVICQYLLMTFCRRLTFFFFFSLAFSWWKRSWRILKRLSFGNHCCKKLCSWTINTILGIYKVVCRVCWISLRELGCYCCFFALFCYHLFPIR